VSFSVGRQEEKAKLNLKRFFQKITGTRGAETDEGILEVGRLRDLLQAVEARGVEADEEILEVGRLRDLLQAVEARGVETDEEILEGMTQVLELTVQLGNYYMAHPSPENKALVKCATLLTAYLLALDHLVHAPTYGEAEIRKLIEILEPHDRNEAALLHKTLLHIRHIVLPRSREQVRQDYANRLMEILNMTVATGRKLLLVRDMKERGMSDAEIDRAIKSPDPPNPF
jgi:hypothetical protein